MTLRKGQRIRIYGACYLEGGLVDMDNVLNGRAIGTVLRRAQFWKDWYEFTLSDGRQGMAHVNQCRKVMRRSLKGDKRTDNVFL